MDQVLRAQPMAQEFQAQLQNAIGLFQIARAHHEQLTTFAILVAFGILGFSMTETYARVPVRWKVGLSLVYSIVTVALVLSIIENALFHNHLLENMKIATEGDGTKFKFHDNISMIGPVVIWYLYVLYLSIWIIVMSFCWGFPGKMLRRWGSRPAPAKEPAHM